MKKLLKAAITLTAIGVAVKVLRKEKETLTAEIEIKITNLDEASEKVEKYNNLLKEAKTLSSELASIEFEIETI